jgi:FtsZ-interacting cell division protein ZipA
MNAWHDIPMLADGVGDVFEIVIFVVIALFWVLGAAFKKLQERKAVEEERRLVEQGRNAQDADSDLFESTGDDEGWQVVSSSPPEQVRQQQLSQPPPLPEEQQSKRQSIGQFVRSARKSLAEQFDTEPEQPSEEFVELQAVQQRQQQLRRKQRELEQQRRLVQKRTEQLKRQADEHRQAQPQAREETAPRQSRYRIGLDDARTARAAIIFHEVLSAPKALREEPELWEL